MTLERRRWLAVTVVTLAIAVLPGTAAAQLVDPTAITDVSTPIRVVVAFASVLLFGGALLAGSYPALYLSGFRPTEVLRSTASEGAGSARLRRGLVVFQFAIAVALLACTGVVYQQLQYIQEKDLGFRDEQVVVADVPEGKSEAFRREARTHSSVVSTSLAESVPGRFNLVLGRSAASVTPNPRVEDDQSIRFRPAAVDSGLGAVSKIVTAGRRLARPRLAIARCALFVDLARFTRPTRPARRSPAIDAGLLTVFFVVVTRRKRFLVCAIPLESGPLSGEPGEHSVLDPGHLLKLMQRPLRRLDTVEQGRRHLDMSFVLERLLDPPRLAAKLGADPSRHPPRGPRSGRIEYRSARPPNRLERALQWASSSVPASNCTPRTTGRAAVPTTSPTSPFATIGTTGSKALAE